MPQVVEVPGLGDVEFPDGMTDDQIAAAIQANMQPAAPQRFGTGKSFDTAADGSLVPTRSDYGPEREIDKWFAAGKNVAQGAGKLATGAVGAVAGNLAGAGALGYDITANFLTDPLGGGQPGRFADPASVKASVADYLTYKPDDQNSLSSRIADAPGQVITGAGKGLSKITGTENIPYLGSMVEAIPEALAGIGGIRAMRPAAVTHEVPYATGGARSVKTEATGKTLPKEAVPTSEQLADAADAHYKASDAAGVVIKPQSTSQVVTMMRDVAKSENLGKLPPKIKEAHDILAERISKNEPLSLRDADKVRQLINDAKKSTDAADQRLAAVVQERYDAYLEGLGPADTLAGNSQQGLALLTEARALFKRRRNSEMLDTMEADAARKGEGAYTQAGVEHALRREFEKLANDKRRRKMLTPAQQAAVDKVVAPGRGVNTLRNIGKFDPARGGMGATLGAAIGGGGGAALGALAGAATGGAVLGPILLGAGANVASRLATRATKGNVSKAREAIVGGGLPTLDGLLAKPGTVQSASQSKGLLGNTATRQPSEIQAEIRRLSALARFELANEQAGSPKVQAFADELSRLQSELAATQANQ
jgi:hypothetical protein